jgi:6-phosphogluconate dehydrogenase (decarboxylating)
VIVDGGNTNFHDDIRRAASLRERRVHSERLPAALRISSAVMW